MGGAAADAAALSGFYLIDLRKQGVRRDLFVVVDEKHPACERAGFRALDPGHRSEGSLDPLGHRWVFAQSEDFGPQTAGKDPYPAQSAGRRRHPLHRHGSCPSVWCAMLPTLFVPGMRGPADERTA